MKQWYGNYAILTEEPTQDIYEQTVKALKDSIPKEHKVDWETFRVIYKTPDQICDLPYGMGDAQYIGPIWTIGMKYQTEVEEE